LGDRREMNEWFGDLMTAEGISWFQWQEGRLKGDLVAYWQDREYGGNWVTGGWWEGYLVTERID